MRKLIFLFILLIFSGLSAYSQSNDSISLSELETRIQRLWEVNDIPAIGISIIDLNGNKLAKAFGYSNLEANKRATENSMFRLGSITKMFAALAILKMRDEGMLTLDDKLSDLVPDVEYENPWEKNHPVRVRHLLNHTTGWDDLHGIEWMTSDPKPLSTKEGIDLHPHTRTSRWPPGTRMAYSNTGAPVAAYIVEEITGMSYEEYLADNFFEPMGLANTGLLYSDAFKTFGVTNYIQGKPINYYHLSGRAAGAMNSTPNELLIMLEFFINRGKVDNVQLISQSSIRDMESLFPDFDLDFGYALCNFTSEYNGLVFQGHNGAIDNAQAAFYYLPEHKIGYSVVASSISGRDFSQLNKLITEYLIQGIRHLNEEIEYDPSSHDSDIEGYYYFASPRNQKVKVIKGLFEPAKVWWENDTLYFGPAFGKSVQQYLPVEHGKYVSAANSNLGISYKTDFDGSRILYRAVPGGAHSFKPMSIILVYGRLVVVILAVVLSLTTLLLGAIWLIQFAVGKFDGQGSSGVIIGPMICSLVLLPTIILFVYTLNHPFDILFIKNAYTVTLYILSLIYGLAAIWSLLSLLRKHKQIAGNAINIYFLIVSLTHALMAIIMMSNEMIGIQTWN